MSHFLLQCKDVESEIINNKFIRTVHSILEDTEKKENFIQVALRFAFLFSLFFKSLCLHSPVSLSSACLPC